MFFYPWESAVDRGRSYKRQRDEAADALISGPCWLKTNVVKAWREGRFTDALVVVEGKEYAVHRAVLAGASKFFDRAFSGSFSEAADAVIRLNMPAAAWEAAADYIYTSAVRIDQASLVPLLEAARFLELPSLEGLLVDRIADGVSPDTFDTAWDAAGRLNLKPLEKKLATMVATCMENVRAFAIARDMSSLPEPVRAALCGEASMQLRVKYIRICMPRDGSASGSKLAVCRRTFALLGGTEDVDDLSMDIDKQAKVSLHFTAPPEACIGQRFQYDYQTLVLPIAAGKVLPAWGEAAPLKVSRLICLPVEWTIFSVRIGDGDYPKTVHAWPGGPTLQLYKLVVTLKEGITGRMGDRVVARDFDFVTGDALVPLWGLLGPRAVLEVRTDADPATELRGLWLPPDGIGMKTLAPA